MARQVAMAALISALVAGAWWVITRSLSVTLITFLFGTMHSLGVPPERENIGFRFQMAAFAGLVSAVGNLYLR